MRGVYEGLCGISDPSLIGKEKPIGERQGFLRIISSQGPQSALSISRSVRSLPGAEYGASRQLGPAGTRYTLTGTLAGKEWEGTDAEIRKVSGISGQLATLLHYI